MPRTRLDTYLRTHRLKAALSQAELGELLGVSKYTISKYELGRRPVSAKILVASAIIFGVNPAELFPALHDAVEEDLAIRAVALHDRLEGCEDAASRKKRSLIEGIPSRLRPDPEP
jgi:transcriptional regulator with XRE-family HTH domain